MQCISCDSAVLATSYEAAFWFSEPKVKGTTTFSASAFSRINLHHCNQAYEIILINNADGTSSKQMPQTWNFYTGHRSKSGPEGMAVHGSTSSGDTSATLGLQRYTMTKLPDSALRQRQCSSLLFAVLRDPVCAHHWATLPALRDGFKQILLPFFFMVSPLLRTHCWLCEQILLAIGNALAVLGNFPF